MATGRGARRRRGHDPLRTASPRALPHAAGVAAVALVALVAVSTLGAAGVWPDARAGASPRSPGGSTTTTVPASTTSSTTVASSTTVPSSTTTTRPKATTTTTRPPSTTATTTPPSKGRKPTLPTSGGSSRHKGGHQPPPPAVTPAQVQEAIGTVDAAIGRVQAINSYLSLRTQVGSARGVAERAEAYLRATEGDEATAVATRDRDLHIAGVVDGELTDLAVAAYTGQAYVNPDAGPDVQSTTGQGADQLDHTQEVENADLLVGIITAHIEAEVGQAHRTVRAAGRTVAAAAHAVRSAARLAADDRRALAATRSEEAAARRNAVRGAAGIPSATASASGPAQGSDGGTGGPGTASSGDGAALAGATGGSDGPTILGRSLVTAPELAGWFASTGERPHTTVPVERLAADYLLAGRRTGVRADVAFAQSIIETGYFSFPAGGQLTGGDNNFAGIGACDSCAHGWRFPTALTGVTAQLELLDAYATPHQVPTPLIGPVGVGGCCTTWMALSGTWATNEAYGVEILGVYTRILDWVIPRRLVQSGLAPHSTRPHTRRRR